MAATTISLEPEWAAVLLVGLPIMFSALGWFIKTIVKTAVSEAESRLNERIEKIERIAQAAKDDAEATLRNQVHWMEKEHHDVIVRPPDPTIHD